MQSLRDLAKTECKRTTVFLLMAYNTSIISRNQLNGNTILLVCNLVKVANNSISRKYHLHWKRMFKDMQLFQFKFRVLLL